MLISAGSRPNRLYDFLAYLQILCLKVYIERNQRKANTCDGRSALGIEIGRPFVGDPFRILEFFFQPLILTFANFGQVLASFASGSVFVIVNWNAEISHELAELPANFYSLFDGYFFYRYKRNHIYGADAGMRADVFCHVYELHSLGG